MTSNQSHPTRTRVHSVYTRTTADLPSPLTRANRNSTTPPRFYFCYTFRTILLLTVRWSLTDRIPVTLACGTIEGTINAACCNAQWVHSKCGNIVRDDSRMSKCHCEITFRFNFGDDSERWYDVILKSFCAFFLSSGTPIIDDMINVMIMLWSHLAIYLYW